MDLTRRLLLGAAAAASAPVLRHARAQARPTIRIGVLTDLSGQNASTAGPTAVACAQQAVADFDASAHGFDVEVRAGDHQNKPDIGSTLARQWFDQDGVDVITDLNNSAVAFAVSTLAVDRDKAVLNTGAVSADLFGKACTPNLVDWAVDSWMLAHSSGQALVKAGGSSWFFIAPDYAFGTAMVNDTAQVVQAAGAKVVGSVRYPFPGNSDFSSFLLQADSSGANVIALAGSGADLENCIKQAGEFGLDRGAIKLAALVGFITNVKSLGLQAAQGLQITETFYWDLNDRTRAFTKRVLPRTPNNYPNSEQAAQYSAVTHYLKAVAKSGALEAKKSGAAVIAAMKAIPVDDDAFGPGEVRQDGRKIQPVHLFEVKKPSESRGDWDLYKLVSTTPADKAYRPIVEGGCKLVKA
jgi:branched-chain amino acid transport system substrate-binding protein